MAATKTITAKFSAIDDFSGPIQQMTAGVTAMVAAVEGMSQRMEAIGRAIGADFSNVSSQSELLSNAMQRVQQAGQAMADSQSQISSVCTQTAAQLTAMTQAAYEAAGADQAVTDAAVALAEQTASLADGMRSAAETQDELTEALDEAQDVMDALNECEDASAETKERLSQAMEEATAAQEALTEAQQEAADAAEEALQIMQSGTATLEEIEAASQRVEDAQRQLAEAEQRAADATDELQDATDEASDGLDDLGDSSDEAAQGLLNLASLDEAKQFLQELYDALMECVEASAQFGESLAKLSTIADTSRVPMSKMRDDIVALSRDTGNSVNELTEATYQAISASVDTANAVDFTATATKLATAGFTESATAVDVLTTVINAYGLEASEATAISDKLITTQNLGKTTVDELASSMGKIIPTAAAQNVSIDQLCAGYVEMTKRGIAAAESTTYMNSMLNELSNSSSKVSQALQQATGQSFAECMANGMSLVDVLESVAGAVGNDTTAFQNLWGSQEAGKAALTMLSATADGFNATLGELQSSAGATEAAFQTMENTTADSLEDMANSFELLKISIGDAFAPVAEAVAGVITNVVSAVTEWIDKNQALASGIVTVVAVFAGLLALVTGVGMAVQVVTTAIGALNAAFAALNISGGPLMWTLLAIAAAVGAVVAIVNACTGALDDETKKYNQASAVAKDYGDTLRDLEGQYDDLVESVGEEAAAQSELAVQVEMARTEYEIMYQTMEEFTAQCDAVCDSVDQMSSSFQEQVQQMERAPMKAQLYMDRLTELSRKTNRTASETQLMNGLLRNLNEQYPGLNASVEDFADATGASAAALKSQIDQMNRTASIEKYTAMLDEASDALADVTLQHEFAEEQLASAQKRYDQANIFEKWGWWGNVKSDLDAATEAVENTGKAMEDAGNWVDFLSGKLGELDGALDGTTSAADDAWNAMTADQQGDVIAAATFDAVREDLNEICQAWDEAAQAATESLLQQGNAFEALERKSEVSMSKAAENMRKSAETMRQYSEDLNAVQSYLLQNTEYTGEQVNQIMQQINTGTPEAMGLARDMASAAAEAGEGSERAAGQLREFSDAAIELNGAAEQAGQTIGGIETNVAEALQNVQQMGTDIISSLDNVSIEAKGKATEAFTGYVQAIADSQGSAVEAANAVGTAAGEAAASSLASSGEEAVTVMNDICSRIMSAASSCHPVIKVTADTSAAEAAIRRINSMSTVKVKAKEANAQGTRFSADVFLAGENGPELVVGAKGSRVYTARETREIMSTLRDVGDPSALDSVAAPEMDALTRLGELAEQMAQQPEAEPQQAADNHLTVEALQAATRAVEGLTDTQTGLRRSLEVQGQPAVNVNIPKMQQRDTGFMDPMGTGMETNNLLTSAEFGEYWNGRNAGLMGWLADKINEMQYTEPMQANFAYNIADELTQKIGADSDGKFTYRRSPDYNPFNELRLEDEFAGISEGVQRWLMGKLDGRTDGDEAVRRNSQAIADFLRQRFAIDPSGNSAGEFTSAYDEPQIMMPSGGTDLAGVYDALQMMTPAGGAMHESEWIIPADIMNPIGEALAKSMKDEQPAPAMILPGGLPETAGYREGQARRDAAPAIMNPAGGSSEPRTLEINVNGKGAITLDGAISADRAAEIASQQIAAETKSVLLNILKQEMSEEGERSYVF